MAVGQQLPANCLGVQGQGTRNLMGTHTTSVGGHMLKCLRRCAAQVVSFKELFFRELLIEGVFIHHCIIATVLCRHLDRKDGRF